MDMITLLPRVLIFQLTSPWLFVPAIAVGWLARTRLQLLLGVGAIGLVSIAMTLMQHRPDSGYIVYWFMPTVFVSPLVWAFATSKLKGLLRRESPEGAPDGKRAAMRAVIGGVGGAVIGGVLGGLLGALIGSISADLFNVSNFEGQAGYYVAILFVLPGIVIGAVAGAIAGAIFLARRR